MPALGDTRSAVGIGEAGDPGFEAFCMKVDENLPLPMPALGDSKSAVDIGEAVLDVFAI